MKLNEEKSRYTIKSCVCDWGIWDNINSCFIGYPIDSYTEALIILKFLKSI